RNGPPNSPLARKTRKVASPALATMGAWSVPAAAPAFWPVMYIDKYWDADDSRKVSPRSPLGAMLILGIKVATPGPPLIWPVCVRVGEAPAVLNSYQRAWAVWLGSSWAVCVATSRPSRQAADKIRASAVSSRTPPGWPA